MAGDGRNTLNNASVEALRRAVKTVNGTTDGQGAYGGDVHPKAFQRYWGKIVGTFSAGTITSPTTCTVDVYLPDPDDETVPYDYIKTTDDDLLGITVVNRKGFSSEDAGSVSSGSGTDCIIEYSAGEWSLVWARQKIVSSVSCNGGGLSVLDGYI